jgi:triacylglycerol lipase
MDRKERWRTLIPGFASDFFSVFNQNFPAPRVTNQYCPGNALLFAELSRWVYNTDNEDLRTQPSDIPRENPYLQKANLREVRLFKLDAAQASLVCTEDQSSHILVFRGSSKVQDWVANLSASATRWWGQGYVHQGFMESFTGIWEQLAPILPKIHTPLFYTGHSLGAAHATLAASLHAPTGLYTYGSPRVGDEIFAEYMKDLRIFRVVNGQDIVTTLPISGPPLNYQHVGELRHFGRSLRWNFFRFLITLRYLFRRRNFVIKTFAKLDDPFHPPPFVLDHAPYFYLLRLIKDYKASQYKE